MFTDLAQRYAERPGGYTRIHKFGNRPGDNAPHAVLELVDNPRDLKFAMTARAVGWELLGKKVGKEGPKAAVASGVPDVEEVISREKALGPEGRGQLRPITRRNIQKVLKYRGSEGVEKMSELAEDHVVRPVFFLTYISSSRTPPVGYSARATSRAQGDRRRESCQLRKSPFEGRTDSSWRCKKHSPSRPR